MSNTIVEAEFRSRLTQVLRGFPSVAEMARKVGVSDNAIYKWLAGRGQPSVTNLVALATASRVSVEWLATGHEPAVTGRATRREGGHGDYTFVPRYDVRVSGARGAAFRNEQVVDYLAFKTEWVTRKLNAEPRTLLLIEMAGDSMAPTLEDGDLALIDLSEPRFKQDGIYVLRREGDLIVKRLQRRPDGKLIVRGDNPVYEATVASRDGLGIIGRVIWTAGRQ
ncbi:MAG TPA: helix-turn-helix transcriptional regulator [Candidatus Binatus sp.]|nr:helix-turn-helix transcriptional regulator [Candidatus Binatus sp.]